MRIAKVVSPKIIKHDTISGLMTMALGLIVAVIGGLFAMSYATTLLYVTAGFGVFVVLCGVWTVFKTCLYARGMKIIQEDKHAVNTANVKLRFIEIPVRQRRNRNSRFEMKQAINIEGTIEVGSAKHRVSHCSVLTEEPKDISNYALRIYKSKRVEGCVILEITHVNGNIIG